MGEKTYPAKVNGGGEYVAELTVDEVQKLDWTTELTNTQRALDALGSVELYGRVREMGHESVSTVMQDLLNDMRHLADALGIDLDEMYLGTEQCYRDELCEQSDPR